ncbi:MAG: toprim domain-containing protein, partial [Planctomycetota bacterium]|nr:toprim domain-containing protein [Planctomycetota bacterium]
NTPEGSLFAKRHVLFGLPAAAKEIAVTRTAVVVEGYTDTIMCHQYGLRNVVATLGTSLTEEHVQRLRRFVTAEGKVVAIFDSDEAGEKATERAARIFMAEGLTLHGATVSALKDACEYLPRFGADSFQRELAQAVEAFQYCLSRVLPDLRDRDVGRRTAAVVKIMDLVNVCPDRVRRAMMRKEVALAAGVPEEALPQPPREGARQPANGRGLGGEMLPLMLGAQDEGRLRGERRILLHALERREWAERIFAVLPPEAFANAAAARIAAFIRERWTAGQPPSLADLASAEREQAMLEILADLALEGEHLPPSAAELEELIWREECRSLEEEGRRILSALQEARQRGDHQEEERLLLRRLEIDRRLRRREKEGRV